MKKISLAATLIFFVTTAFSQIKFEKGYFIDNDGNKVECLIQNGDWLYNPAEIEYKIDENSQPKKIGASSIKEFGFTDHSKYISRQVNIDRSPDKLNDLNESPDPVFSHETLLLKVIVEGKANLYFYTDDDIARFFYSVNDAPIEQLIHKTYRNYSVASQLGENKKFKQQLFRSLQCSSIDNKKFETVGYAKTSLTRIFTAYNTGCGNGVTTYEGKEKRNALSLNIRPRLNYSNLVVGDYRGSRGIGYEWDGKANFGMGVELEYFVRSAKRKWSVIVEPTYQYFNGTTKKNQRIATTKYNSIELPIGLRHHFYLGESGRIFVNASFIYDVVFKSSNLQVKSSNGFINDSAPLGNHINFAFGAGYRYKVYGVEVRYQTPRDILGSYSSGWQGDYETTSLILSYSLGGKRS